KQNANLLIDLAKESLTLRTRELDRVKTLKQSGATSESEFDEAERSFLEARQLLTAQENLLRGLEAERKSLVTAQQLAAIGLEKAKLDRRRTTILAPFSGVVISQLAEANSHVQAGDNIAKIEDTSKVEVRCSLRKEDLEFLPAIEATATDSPADAYRLPPLPVTVQYTRAGRNFLWNGVLSRQDGLGMDERTRTMPVRILVDDPLGCRVDSQDTASRPIALVRGMFVQVELHCRPDRPLLTIPEETIRPGKTVWIMENEQLKIKPIHIARIEDSVAYVDARGGSLSREHAIISSPVPGAKQGLAVTINAPRKAGPKQGGPQGPNKGGGRKRAGKPAASTAEKSDKSSMRSPRSDASALVSDESKIQ
ncbi:MAG: HlyD family efflux transporter periplasmic adaptor subunit, partial [Fuerstiella sp.]|nr:HlyD family efflux transporter periplasmic adaptor subunit [Fuerstiella sp.]